MAANEDQSGDIEFEFQDDSDDDDEEVDDVSGCLCNGCFNVVLVCHMVSS